MKSMHFTARAVGRPHSSENETKGNALSGCVGGVLEPSCQELVEKPAGVVGAGGE